MSEVKTIFPVNTTLKSRFPVAKEGKPDEVSSEAIREVIIKKANQEDVNFQSPSRTGKYCKNCLHFDSPASCYGVNGMIRPGDWCSHYKEEKGIGMPPFRASNTTNNLPQTGIDKHKK